MGEPSDTVDPQVLYIAGWGRSGSTLLETLLGGEGAVSVGETFQLWSSSPLARYCSCGRPLADCPVWSHVIGAFDEPWDDLVDEMRSIRRRRLRVRHLRQLLRTRAWSGSADVTRYGVVMRTVYRAVAEATGATTLIDSSKAPVDLAAISPSCPQLRVIHLVRDPRAVAASWKRDIRRDMPDGSTLRMPTYAPWASAARWDLYHGLTSVVVRAQRLATLRISYESLVRLEKGAIADLASFTNEPHLPDRPRQAAAQLGLEVPVQHAIAGNPGRRSGESLLLREDDSWSSELSSHERLAVRAIGLPYPALRRPWRSAGRG